MEVLILSVFSGINIAFALLSLFIWKNNKTQKLYLYFGIFSIFSGFYFILIGLSSVLGLNVTYAIIFCAAVYYGVFPWLIFRLIQKKKKTYAFLLALIFAIAFVFFVLDKTESVFPIWQIIAHIGLFGLFAVVIYASIKYFQNKLKGANEFLILTIIFILLGLEEIVANYTGIVLLRKYLPWLPPLDIYPLLFTVIVGFRLSNDFYSKNKMKFNLLEIDLKEKQMQLILLEKKRLEDTLQFKTKDLTNFGIEITKNKEFLQKLYLKLDEIKKSEFKDSKNLNEILKTIKSRLIINKEHNYFNGNVEKINHEFTIKLKKNYPSLTANEIQLASFLRLNLNSKEIAAIKNIEPNSVKVLRYRIRKKMNLKTSINLSEFLNNLN
tara:strand:- start:25220 stop:26362 length:1143 start_codon:yes stop_codon:yes gene_type:complete